MNQTTIKRIEMPKAELAEALNEMQFGYATDTGEVLLKKDGKIKTYKPDQDLHDAMGLVRTPGKEGR